MVAKVLDLRPHPDADRIQIVEVDSGDGEPLQICCGAFNMSPGDFVPVGDNWNSDAKWNEISRRKLSVSGQRDALLRSRNRNRG